MWCFCCTQMVWLNSLISLQMAFYFLFQRFIFKQLSNLWSTYHQMQGTFSKIYEYILFINLFFFRHILYLSTFVPCCLSLIAVSAVFAAYLMQYTPSSKTKFTVCLSLTLSQGTHFIFSHTRGSSSSSSCLWVQITTCHHQFVTGWVCSRHSILNKPESGIVQTWVLFCFHLFGAL